MSCVVVCRAGMTEALGVLIVAVIMQVYAFVTCHKILHQKAIFTVHKLYDDGNKSSKLPQRGLWDLWDLDLTLPCLALVRHGKHCRMKGNSTPHTPHHRYSVVSVLLESVWCLQGLRSHRVVQMFLLRLAGDPRGDRPRAPDTAKRNQLCTKGPNIFCACSVTPIKDRFDRKKI